MQTLLGPIRRVVWTGRGAVKVDCRAGGRGGGERCPRRHRRPRPCGVQALMRVSPQPARSELVERYNQLVVAAALLSEDDFWAGVMEERAKAAAAAAVGGAPPCAAHCQWL